MFDLEKALPESFVDALKSGIKVEIYKEAERFAQKVYISLSDIEKRKALIALSTDPLKVS